MAHFKSILLFFIFAGVAQLTFGQNRYIVYFKDKNNSPFSISAPDKYLSPKSIARRIKQDITITASDLPVNPAYIAQVNATGAKVYFSSRWLNCALIQTTTDIKDVVAGLSSVSSVLLVAPGAKLSGRVRAFKKRTETDGAEATRTQLQMVDIDVMQSENILGDGVSVAILDSGYEGVNTATPFQHLFQSNHVVSVYDFVGNSKDVYRYDDHGTEVLSVIAANSTSYTGGAYGASFHLFVTEEVVGEQKVEEYNWLFAAERADSIGVDVITTSLGYNTFDAPSVDYNRTIDLDGKTAIVSKAAQAALDRGIVVVCSAGNEAGNDWGTVTPPADVEGVLTVGSVTAAGVKSSFSSIGPTSDGRIKPDVVALGSGVSVVKPSGLNGFTSGTSVSAPIVASLVIGLLQKFPNINPKVITQTIMSTASQADTPDNRLGYGIPSYSAVKSALEGQVDDITVSPNPTDTGTFNVRFKQTNVQATIVVYDLHGHVLSSHVVDVKPGNNPIVIDVAELPASSYLVKVKTSDNFMTFRLVKL